MARGRAPCSDTHGTGPGATMGPRPRGHAAPNDVLGGSLTILLGLQLWGAERSQLAASPAKAGISLGNLPWCTCTPPCPCLTLRRHRPATLNVCANNQRGEKPARAHGSVKFTAP